MYGSRPRSNRTTHRVAYANDDRGVAPAEWLLLMHGGKPFTLRAVATPRLSTDATGLSATLGSRRF
jgi:hypothetical protein